MNLHFPTILACLLNLLILGGIIYIVFRFIKSVFRINKSSERIEEKLDTLIEIMKEKE